MRCTSVAVLAVVLAYAMPTAAHVGPSVRENNRYVKLTVLGDRVRLLYTYYLGELPGAQARARLDRDRDGLISDDEAASFGDQVAATIAGNLRLRLDGATVAPQWSSIDVGLGTPSASAGAFSVDLIAWLCPSEAAGGHELVVFDRFEPPQPGETGLRIEAGPGVDVGHAAFGADGTMSQLEFRWVGGGGPLARDGLFVRYDVAADAPRTDDAVCGAETKPATASRSAKARWPWLAGGAVLLAALVVAFVRYRNTNG